MPGSVYVRQGFVALSGILILLGPSPSLLAYQDCTKLKVTSNIVEHINSREIAGNGNKDIASQSIITATFPIDTPHATVALPLNVDSVPLNFKPESTRRNVWECTFAQPAAPTNLFVRYRPVSLQGEAGYFSTADGAKIPVTVETDQLRWNQRNTKVTGDIRVIYDFAFTGASSSGPYSGTIEIEVYEE